ncbi:MAG: hypothetical protein GEU77_08320 [Deltaproteobacteria bacterium]|nr:hypothetical protein [Deltaproteobacteria bacterium]
MPGFSFFCDFEGSLPDKQSRISGALDLIMHHDGYEKRILLNDRFSLLACTKYKHYPVIPFENERFLIHLEGKIYGKGKSLIRDELNAVAQWLSDSACTSSKDVVQWLLNTDGDFVLFILDKRSNSIFFLNDALSRLPLYYSTTTNGFIVSREVQFIKEVKIEATLDRMGIAQCLLFGYPLGTRTLLDKVHRLTPASVIRVDIDQARAEVTQLHYFNFEVKQDPVRAPEENAQELVRLFSMGCKSRATDIDGLASTGKNILGLSGGFDSRSVAACLHNENIPFVAVTRLDPLKHSISDAKMAEQLAEVLDLDWKLFYVKSPKGRDLLKLLKIKSGLNYLGMAFILPFFEQVRDSYGPDLSYFTGEGGNTIPRDLRPKPKLKTLDDAVNHLLAHNQKLPVETVAALINLPKDDIIAEVRALLSGYPENNWSHKYVHFFVSEKSFKLTFEAEDRNRCYFWSVAPFFSTSFFKFGMECPDSQKEKFALYREFLINLSPIAASVPHASWKIPISGKRYLLYLFGRSVADRIPSGFKNFLRAAGQSRYSGVYYICITDQVKNCKALRNYIDCDFLKSIASRCSSIQIQNLLTITSMIEQFECNQSTLQKYYETEFM